MLNKLFKILIQIVKNKIKFNKFNKVIFKQELQQVYHVIIVETLLFQMYNKLLMLQKNKKEIYMELNQKKLIKMELFQIKHQDKLEVDIYYVIDVKEKQEDIVNQMQKRRNSLQVIYS